MAPKRDRTSTGSEPQNRQRARLDDETTIDGEPEAATTGPQPSVDVSGDILSILRRSNDNDGCDDDNASGEHDGGDDDDGNEFIDGLAVAQGVRFGSIPNVEGSVMLEGMSGVNNEKKEGENGDENDERDREEEEGEEEEEEEEEEEGEVIGSYTARFVKRNQLFGNFQISMDDVSAEMVQLAEDLFDEEGSLKTQFSRSRMGQGKGPWGYQLDLCDILLPEEMEVDEPYRRQSLGRAMFIDLHMRARAASADSAGEFAIICTPSALTRVVRREAAGTGAAQAQEAARQEAVALEFFRSMGFKRIGSSKWYAFIGIMW